MARRRAISAAHHQVVHCRHHSFTATGATENVPVIVESTSKKSRFSSIRRRGLGGLGPEAAGCAGVPEKPAENPPQFHPLPLSPARVP